MPKVSVIIPAYNEEKDIKNCLDSLFKQSYKDFEILVIDDGSTDKTKLIAKKYNGVKLIEGAHKGPGFSRNFGAKNSKGEILVFVDADMTFDKDYLKNLVSPILKDKEIIGTTHENEIANNTENIYSRLWGRIRLGKQGAEDVKIFRAIRKDAFFRMGGFDPKYGYADDQTFWFKFKIKPVVAKNALCYHNNPETLDETFKHAVWIGTSWKERFKIFQIPLINYIFLGIFLIGIPFFALIKSMKSSEKGIKFGEKFSFFWFKFKGYSKGINKAVLRGEIWK